MKYLILVFFTSIVTHTFHGQTIDTTVIRMEIDSLIRLNTTLKEEKKIDEAFTVLQQAEKKCQNMLGERNEVYTKLLTIKGFDWLRKGNYKEAEDCFLKSKTIQEEIVGKQNSGYLGSIRGLGIVYGQMGKPLKAEPLFLEAKELTELLFGKNHIEYARSVGNLALCNSNLNRWEKAETLYLETIALYAKILGKDHVNYTISLCNLGNLYYEIGNYKKAEKFLLESKTLLEGKNEKNHRLYNSTIGNLGLVYLKQDLFEKAEPLLLKSLELDEEIYGKSHPLYASGLTSLGSFYYSIGNYEQAESFYLKAIHIKEAASGKKNNSTTLDELKKLGNVYIQTLRYDKAIEVYNKAIMISEKEYGRNHGIYARNLENLAITYAITKEVEKAQSLFNESISIKEKLFGTQNHNYLAGLANFAVFNYDLGNFEKAATLLSQIILAKEKIFGNKQPYYVNDLTSLANAYWAMGHYEKTDSLYSKAAEIEKMSFIRASQHLSEKELLNYIQDFAHHQNLRFSFSHLNDKYSKNIYDEVLFQKGFVWNTVYKIRHKAQNNTNYSELYNLLKSYYRQLAFEYSKPIENRTNITKLEEKANSVEKELAQKMPDFGELFQKNNWKKVQAALKTGQAAIEYIHYNFQNPHPTDSIMYGALILSPKLDEPIYVPLFEEEALTSILNIEKNNQKEYINQLYSIDDHEIQKKLYDLIWMPLKEHLKDIETIYFSPSGLLYKLHISAIPYNKKETLADRYHLIQVNSTRQLVFPDTTVSTSNEALLFGGIYYDFDSLAIIQANNEIISDNTSDSNLGFQNIDGSRGGDSWKPLKWTTVEVLANEQLLKSADFETSLKTGYAATEEAFQQIGISSNSPRILHLATHGFFYPDPESVSSRKLAGSSFNEPVFKMSDHPMIRSGLIMAGGNRAWEGLPPLENMEDGILTAYEISQMDLSNTELVVLSACETGLGDIQGNEGVYGLQRAFKIAGARYLIMSLWQVPDFQTQELMTTFYENWLVEKMTIREAFRAAQNEMREKHVDPFYWAGFVLVE